LSLSFVRRTLSRFRAPRSSPFVERGCPTSDVPQVSRFVLLFRQRLLQKRWSYGESPVVPVQGQGTLLSSFFSSPSLRSLPEAPKMGLSLFFPQALGIGSFQRATPFSPGRLNYVQSPQFPSFADVSARRTMSQIPTTDDFFFFIGFFCASPESSIRDISSPKQLISLPSPHVAPLSCGFFTSASSWTRSYLALPLMPPCFFEPVPGTPSPWLGAFIFTPPRRGYP